MKQSAYQMTQVTGNKERVIAKWKARLIKAILKRTRMDERACIGRDNG